MELAGLSCAVAIAKCFPRETYAKNNSAILVCCGPGNNGGDGLVCARHLKLFGYNPSIFYPKRPSRTPLSAMRVQCEKMDIPFLSYLPSEVKLISDSYNVIVDALFGFSFIGPPRPEFQTIISKIISSKVPIACIDVPSGWDIDNGSDEGIQPEMLISLTAPKLCSKDFKGRYHYLGGRFVPQELAKRYKLNLPAYQGTECVVELAIQEPDAQSQK